MKPDSEVGSMDHDIARLRKLVDTVADLLIQAANVLEPRFPGTAHRYRVSALEAKRRAQV